jgi:hypothetical protein
MGSPRTGRTKAVQRKRVAGTRGRNNSSVMGDGGEFVERETAGARRIKIHNLSAAGELIQDPR